MFCIFKKITNFTGTSKYLRRGKKSCFPYFRFSQTNRAKQQQNHVASNNEISSVKKANPRSQNNKKVVLKLTSVKTWDLLVSLLTKHFSLMKTLFTAHKSFLLSI